METFLQFSEVFAGNIFLYVFALFFSISFVVFVHELGHYSAARCFGVRIDTFSIGFGKELIGRTDKRGTRWVLSLLPLGGYVKIFGDVNRDDPKIWDAEKEEIRTLTKKELEVAFCTKKLWQRVIIIAAGPAINFFFTFLILITLYSTIGQSSTLPIVTAVVEGTSGYEAGFLPLDEILAVDGNEVRRFEDVWEFTKNNPGQDFDFTIKRGGQIITITAASRQIDYKDTRGLRRVHGRLGATHITALEYKDIVSVNGVDVDGDEDKARREISNHLDEPIRLGIEYGQDKSDVFLTSVPSLLNEDMNDPLHKDYDKIYTGVTKEKFHVYRGLPYALLYAGRQMKELSQEALKVMELILSGGASRDSIGGMGTMGQMAGKAMDAGWYTFSLFIAVMSFQIGFVNLLPIPLLDGGYLMFLAYEAVRGRPLPQRVQDYAFSLGLAFLVGIMVFANLSDIFQFTR